MDKDALQGILGPTMLALLGVFLIFIAFGALWGTIRGFKRSWIRLATVVVAMGLALLMTPLFSKALINMNIPGLGKSGGSYIDEMLFAEGQAGAGFADKVPDLVALVKACAVVVVNFVLFFILFIVMKIVSWIIYAVLAHFFAPKKRTVEGEVQPIKRYRLAGLGIGVVTGLVFFAFFMIPITGSMQTLNAAAGYTPTFASFDLEKIKEENKDEDGIAGTIVEVYEVLDTVNGQIQSSAFGKITKHTGVQAFGGWSVSYLSRVETKKHDVNLKNDLTKITHIAADMLAITYELTREGEIIDKVEQWETKEYQALQRLVDRIFQVDFVILCFEYTGEIVDVLEDEKMLDDRVGGIYDDPGFTPAVYEGIRTFTKATKLRDDLKSFIEIARLCFAKGNDGVGFFYDVKAIIDNFDDTAKAQDACDALAKKLSSNSKTGQVVAHANLKANIADTNAYKITKAFFGLHLIQALLNNESLENLYKVPLSDVLDIEQDKITITSPNTNWDNVSKDSAKLLIDLVRAASDVIAVAKGEGDMETRISEMNVEAIGDVLDTLTNGKGIGKFVRQVLLKNIDKLTKEMGDDSSPIKMDSIVDTLKAKLDNDDDIDWKKELEIIRKMAVFVLGIGNIEGLDPKDLGELLKLIGDSMLGDVALDLVNEMLADTGVAFEIPSEYIGPFFGILGDAAGTLVDLFNGETDDIDAEALIGMLSGEDGILTQLADLNEQSGDQIVIDISGIDGVSDLAQILTDAGYTGSALDETSDIAKILKLFKTS